MTVPPQPPQQHRQADQPGRRARDEASRRRIESLMRDQRYDRLRTRRARRLLAGTMLLCVAALPVAFLLGGSWAGLPVVMACAALWFTLRTSLRLVADLPEEYLDERQARLRNRAYVEAYRWLGAVAILASGAGFIAFMVQGKDPDGDTISLTWNQASAAFMFVTALALTVPSIVLALRDEERP